MYLTQYVNQKKFENEKQIKTFWNVSGKISIYEFEFERWRNYFYVYIKCKWKYKKIIKYIPHDFKNEIQNYVLNYDQLHVLYILNKK